MRRWRRRGDDTFFSSAGRGRFIVFNRHCVECVERVERCLQHLKPFVDGHAVLEFCRRVEPGFEQRQRGFVQQQCGVLFDGSGRRDRAGF